MKMLFVYPDVGSSRLNYSPAIEILSACLKQAGNEVFLLHINDENAVSSDPDVIYKKVAEINPDLLGFTSLTNQYAFCNKTAGELKKRGFDKLIVLGGIHATISPQDFESSNFDAFLIGEGEKSLVELCRRIENNEDYYSVKGTLFRKNGEIIDNGSPEIICDLDTLPARDYEIMDIEKILLSRNKWLGTAFSRGCPYSCSFCINQKLRKQYKLSAAGSYYRCQSVEKVFDDLLPVIEKYRNLIEVIDLDDDLLMMDKKWFMLFSERFRKEIYEPYGIKYAINGRADLVDEDIVKQLSLSGCYLVQIGFETGNEKLRNEVLKKGIRNDDLIKSFDLFNKYKVRSLAYCMIGIPEESEESINESISLLRRLKPTLIRMTVFEPFIGTPLYDYCKEHKLMINRQSSKNSFGSPFIKFENLASAKLKQYHLLYPWYMNIGFVKEKAEKYEKLIAEFSSLSEEDLMSENIRNKVIQTDKIISAEMTKEKTPHFRYFENNNFYYNFVSSFD